MPSQKLPRPAAATVEPTLYEELIRRGLPADYARRTAEELDDHRADLVAELRTSGAAEADAIAAERLGATRELAKRIARDYRRRTWVGRHPFVCFVLAPVPVWIALALFLHFALYFAVQAASFAFGGAALGWFDGLSQWGRTVAYLSTFLACYALAFCVVPTVVARWLAGLALRSTRRGVWAVAAAGLIAIAAATLTYDVRISLAPGESRFFLSSPPVAANPVETASAYLRPLALAQMAGPLLACGGLLLEHDRRRRAALLAPAAGGSARRVAA